MAIKFTSFDSLSTRKGFIFDALKSNLRLDGRSLKDMREPKLTLTRNESICFAELQLGQTRVCSSVRGELQAPFPDRPTEGMLQFIARTSPGAQAAGFGSSDICRQLERFVRESDAVDLESLCVIGGEKVWVLVCEVNLLDFAGNAIDACIFSAISALRAFRRPDVTISTSSQEDFQKASVVCHSFDDCEPLPLAFHHTPLCVSIALFCKPHSNERLLAVDPSAEEEACLDGKIVYCINAHREICGFQKPGGLAISVDQSLASASLADNCAAQLHSILSRALATLEHETAVARTSRINRRGITDLAVSHSAGEVALDDTILSFANLHKSVELSSEAL